MRNRNLCSSLQAVQQERQKSGFVKVSIPEEHGSISLPWIYFWKNKK